jgi:hypothetical protein
VRGKVIADDRNSDLVRVEGVQVAAEFQELGAPLDRLDVAVELVLGQDQGGEQVPYSAVAVVGRPAPPARLTVRVLVLAAALGPLFPGVRDADTLTRWLLRAPTATSTEDLFTDK